MTNDGKLSDTDASAKAAADAAVDARAEANRLKDAAGAADATAKTASSVADADPLNAAARSAADMATADAAAKTAAAKAATDAADAADKAASDGAAKTNADAAATASAAKAAADTADAADKAASDATAKGAADAAEKATAAAKAGAATGGNGDVPASVQTSFFDLLKTVVVDPKLSAQDKERLLAKLGGMSPTNDIATFKWAIWILGALAILSIIGIFTLAITGHSEKIPDGLVALGSGAAGALAGLLNGSKSSDTPH